MNLTIGSGDISALMAGILSYVTMDLYLIFQQL
jgi:hypothetical protein